MAVEHNIKKIDEQGVASVVLTDYKVHTISLVGKGALGRNITKLKSTENFIKETEEGKAIMTKIKKAKALDAEETKVEAVEPEVVAEDAIEADKAKSVEEQTQEIAEEAVETASDETLEVEAVVDQVEEESASEDVTVAVEDTQEPEKEQEEVLPESEVVDAEETVEPNNEGEEVEKAKMYSVDEYLEASKSALDGMAKLVKEIKDKAPEADHWEVFDIVYSAVYAIDDASWYADDALWNKVWDEVYTEVTSRVNKSKSLKVSEAGTVEDKLKALEAIDPELAKLFQAERETNKAKALEAEEQREAVIRAKALEEGAEKYKRISSEDCSTDQITDAMLNLEVSNPEAYKVVAKALDNASVITSAGELFRDLGTSDTVNTMSADEFVTSKAKSIAADKDAKGESYNMAALRATVRQSDEFVSNYVSG